MSEVPLRYQLNEISQTRSHREPSLAPMQPISIRPLAEADAETLVQAVRESYDEVSPWMVWCRPDYSLEHALSWIGSTITGRESGTSYEFGAFDSQGTFAGVCGVNHINPIDRFANLGYWVRTSASRHGVAPAAVIAVAEWTFANTELNRLEIVAALGNHRSQRVAQKVGARREGVLRQRLLVGGRPSDAVMFSLVRPLAADQFTDRPEAGDISFYS